MDYTSNALKIWFSKPAGQDWNSALPIGNGRLGGMVFGNITSERIALNEDTLWNGSPQNRNNPAAKEALPKIREHLANGKAGEAEKLANEALAGVPDAMNHFEPLGDLLLDMEHSGAEASATEYRRELDLTSAAVKVEYNLGGTLFTRTQIASAPDSAIVVRLEASTPGAISFKLRLERKPGEGANTGYVTTVRKARPGKAGLIMTGRSDDAGGLRFAACVRAEAEGGEVSNDGESLTVKGADAVTLVLCAAVSFLEPDPTGFVTTGSSSALGKGWAALREAQEADYRALFERLNFQLGTPEEAARASQLPTDERLRRLAAGELDLGLYPLYMQFGRYLLISSSRSGGLPANLQGVWNQDYKPAWGSKFTLNINTQMNYWLAEPGNLAECHSPLLALVERMVEPGRRTAQTMYGCGGFVAHHNTDIWADTAPVDKTPSASYWPLGGAWLALHQWESFAFSQDPKQLERAYPVLKEACQFFLDFLIPDKDGRLVVSPTVSPENSFKSLSGEAASMCAGAALDSAILSALFRCTSFTAGALERDPDFRKSVDAALGRLPEIAVGQHGQIMEWLEDYEEMELEHRHLSPLFPLYPGDQITRLKTPELAAAAQVSLTRRGDSSTGWSMAWKINLRARLAEAEYAHALLVYLLRPAEGDAGGSYPNLFCAHPPFQIDGNLGGAAAILEMLVQSHETTIDEETGREVPILRLIPALPEAWSQGKLTGIRARGGYELELEWQEGALQVCRVQANANSGGIFYLGLYDTLTRIPLESNQNLVLELG